MDGEDGVYVLVVFKVSDMSWLMSMLCFFKYEVLVNFVWISVIWLIVEKGCEYGLIDKLMLIGEIFVMDFDGKYQDYFYGCDLMKYG